MHLLGTEFLAYAVTPARDTVPLVRINDWDFRWQAVYTFPRMVPCHRAPPSTGMAPSTTRRENPHQPFDPPRHVTGADSRFMRTHRRDVPVLPELRGLPAGDDTVRLTSPRFCARRCIQPLR